ncbi:MAG: Ribokinase [uncultured Chloroflexi bacterium]|uniref:Ribokinase n=1 Tax=uncultured Chloroflexota bacterium TaxID=166587 RepID=A0A6J4K073_9CHLR|nr:MAG: Ribokinase [uncultured Chloroflexota bacterium]
MPGLDIVGLGFCCTDELLLLSEIPPAEGRATIRRRDRQGGGMVSTAMAAAARLGGRAGFLGAVGDDWRGRWILEDFRRNGVDVSRLVVRPGATSHETVVLVDERSGARSFLTDRGNAKEIQPNEVDREYVTQARYLHLSDASPVALLAAEWAHAAGAEVGFDGTHFHPMMWPILPQVDYLIVSRFFASEFATHIAGHGLGRAAADFAGLSVQDPHVASTHPETEAPALTGEELLGPARGLREAGSRVVIVTEGERGSWCTAPEGEFHVPAYQVDAVDTTGAGDVFHGAFLYALARGWDLRRSLEVASATAALKCRALGGRAGIPTLEAVLSLVDGRA